MSAWSSNRVNSGSNADRTTRYPSTGCAADTPGKMPCAISSKNNNGVPSLRKCIASEECIPFCHVLKNNYVMIMIKAISWNILCGKGYTACQDRLAGRI